MTITEDDNHRRMEIIEEWKALKNEIVERRKRTCYRIEISKGYKKIMKENTFLSNHSASCKKRQEKTPSIERVL